MKKYLLLLLLICQSAFAYDPNHPVLDSNPLPATVMTSGSSVSAANPFTVVTEYGSIISNTDHYGTQQYNAPNGETVAIPLFKLVGDSFALESLDTGMWATSLGAGGSAVVTAGELTVSTGTTANNSTIVESKQVARFIGLGPNKIRALVQIPDTGIANNIRQWGVDHAVARDNGALFRLSGTTFSIVTKKANVETVISSGSFNGQYGATFSPGTISHVYEIIYQPRQVVFIVDSQILHTVNANTAPWTDTLHLHVHFESTNSGGQTANAVLKARLGVIARFAIPDAQKTGVYQSGITTGITLKVGPGDLHGIILSGIANNSDVTLYDNTIGSGTVLFSTGTMPANTTPIALDLGGISFNNGLTLVISGAASNALVIFD